MKVEHSYSLTNMQTYRVDLISDLDEQVTTHVEANDYDEAMAIGMDMLERGELDCAGMICAACTAYQTK